MKISKIIKNSSLIAILGFGTVFTALADLIPDLLGDQHVSNECLTCGMVAAQIEGLARNPDVAPLLNCIVATNYAAIVDHLSSQAYEERLVACE